MGRNMFQTVRPALPLILSLIGLAFAVTADTYIQKRQKRILRVIMLLLFSLIAQNLLDYRLQTVWTNPPLRELADAYGYIARPFILLLFIFLVGAGTRRTVLYGLTGVNTVLYLLTPFTGICFRIDEENSFIRGPLGYCCHAVCAVLLVYLLYESLQIVRAGAASDREAGRSKNAGRPKAAARPKGSGRKGKPGRGSRRWNLDFWIPAGNGVLIAAAVIADTLIVDTPSPVSYLTMTAVCGTVFYYIWLHLQFVHQHEQALLNEQRIQIMMSQIQPHFLYNTLSTIQALCRIDPETASDTIGKFGIYLRQNIDSLSQPDLIPVQKELEHTRIYAEIEQLRFPSIHVEYDEEDTDFQVPALTIQPLVENAIRHGVRIRKDGRVTVRTRSMQGYHEIVIRDNGKGFVVEEAMNADETHIGIRNVKDRVEQLCGGTLEIDSRLGEGTTVTIHIPFSGEEIG